MNKTIYFGSVPVGESHEPLLLPDIDMFFNKDLDLARKVIADLVASGVKVIKGAVIHDATIALDNGALETFFCPDRGLVQENYRALMERKVMPLGDHLELFRLIRSLGPELVLSVYDIEGAVFAKDVGACALKIPSTNITHFPLISFVSGLDLPIIIDTGKSTLEEIARAYQWAKDSGANDIVIEHSPEAPPSSLNNHNLKMIPILRQNFDALIGLSDHHSGDQMMHAAVALGACILEKGVCDDSQPIDQDVFHSMRISEVKGILKDCTDIFHGLGGMRYLKGNRGKPLARMGIVAKRDFEIGDVLKLEDVHFAFPAVGIGCEYWPEVQGVCITKAIKSGEPVYWSNIGIDKK